MMCFFGVGNRVGIGLLPTQNADCDSHVCVA